MNSPELKQTPLFTLHLQLGGKMVPFAGYALPVQYPTGIIREHHQTRESASLFDVSHMGQIKLSGDGAASALESLVPVDVIDLAPYHQRYAVFTNERGGILDDLIITNAGDHLFIVVNGACKQQDTAHIESCIGDQCNIEVLDDRALIAVQGPKAVDAIKRLAPAAADLVFMTAAAIEIDGVNCFVTRSGYTGEDGFEISIPNAKAAHIAQLILDQEEVKACGLGARDSLRLESGLCLYGHDLTTETTPVEASLLWALSKVRRADGERAGGYPGADTIFRQISEKPLRKRVGLKPLGKAPVREGAEIQNSDGTIIGQVTSGGFGATVGGPVAMGYVSREQSEIGTQLNAVVRGKLQPIEVAKLPFVTQRYYRG